jgi:hypothetical protein
MLGLILRVVRLLHLPDQLADDRFTFGSSNQLFYPAIAGRITTFVIMK